MSQYDQSLKSIEFHYFESKKCLREAAKLNTCFFIGFDAFEEIHALHSIHVNLQEHQIKAAMVCKDIQVPLKALETMIDSSLQVRSVRAMKSNYFGPEERSINQSLNDLYHLKGELSLKREGIQSKFIEYLKSQVNKVYSEDPSSTIFIGMIKKQYHIQDLKNIRRLNLTRTALIDKNKEELENRVQALQKKLEENQKPSSESLETSRHSKDESEFLKHLQNAKQGRDKKYKQFVEPLQKKIQELEDKNPGKLYSERPELKNSDLDKFHFVFLLNNGQTMDEKKTKEAYKCMEKLIQSRKTFPDLYSVIPFLEKPEKPIYLKKTSSFESISLRSCKRDGDIQKAIEEAITLIKDSPSQDFIPVIIIITDGLKFTKAGFMSVELQPDSNIKSACKSLEQAYNAFKKFRLITCVANVGSSNPVLRDLAKAGNGGQLMLRLSEESYHLCNQARDHNILPSIFDDFSKTPTKPESSNNEDTIKILRDTLQENIKLIDDEFASETKQYSEYILNYESASTTQQEKMKSFKEEEIQNLQEEINRKTQQLSILSKEFMDLLIKAPTQTEITILEAEVKQELEKIKAISTIYKQEPRIINPQGINIKQGIHNLENFEKILRQRSVNLDSIINSLMGYVLDLSEKLKNDLSPGLMRELLSNINEFQKVINHFLEITKEVEKDFLQNIL